jgi:hypothetical protein
MIKFEWFAAGNNRSLNPTDSSRAKRQAIQSCKRQAPGRTAPGKVRTILDQRRARLPPKNHQMQLMIFMSLAQGIPPNAVVLA